MATAAPPQRRLDRLAAMLASHGGRAGERDGDEDESVLGPLAVVESGGVGPYGAAAAGGSAGAGGAGKTVRIGDVTVTIVPPSVPEYVPRLVPEIYTNSQVRRG